jgi:hypothetical protein
MGRVVSGEFPSFKNQNQTQECFHLLYAPNPFEGARKARGGERQFAAGRGLAESNLHLFEPVQLLL